jgi:hypothetical protein
MACQSPSFKVDQRGPQDLRRQTEIISVEDPHTRIKICLLLSLIVVRIVIVNGILVMHGGRLGRVLVDFKKRTQKDPKGPKKRTQKDP